MIETYKGGTRRKLPTTTTLNNFIDFIFDMRISVLKQKQMKQSKIKVKKERKEQLNIIIKEKLLGYVRLLRYSYGKKI